MMKDKPNKHTYQKNNMPTLCDLTKHPTPDVLTADLITSVTVSTLNKWIREKGLQVGNKNIHKVKRHEKEAALLLTLMLTVSTILCTI
jgi:hypothetical protein